MIVSDDRAALFVSQVLDVGFCPPWAAMGIERDGEIIAGVVYNCFEGADVHLSVAGSGWTRAFFRAVASYVYDTLKCERMTFVTESDLVAGMAVRLGGKVEGRLRSHFGAGRDGIIVGILRDECRYGKQSQFIGAADLLHAPSLSGGRHS